MTVGELIAALEKFPKHYDVVSEFGEHWDAEVIGWVGLMDKSDASYYMSGPHPGDYVVKLE